MSAYMAIELLKAFEARHGLVLPDLDQVAGQLEVLQLKRRENAFRQGEPAVHVYVVRSGLLKQLYIREDGTEWIKSFTGSGDLFACIHAITRRQPASFASVAIVPSVLERIDFAWLERRAESSIAWQKAIRIAFQRLAELKVERERDLLTLSPRQLYEQLVASQPAWLPDVPQKDLAAYLGVTPVGLNRIIRASRR
jgi:CRP-like cAMP-binding protein